ncbi:hypothetical protein GUJ93_ZPchr0006g42008 [Zizania palustris]|uniref:Endoplasmic reticulum transmembrane protein n=1 Tax=Zizania palustris TaxID=103762 RepID=A0A8J5SGP4_ZIZPA|nr:hypothetical protein GUJ93_ZPchr0006g42008 [Zizania palustris]
MSKQWNQRSNQAVCAQSPTKPTGTRKEYRLHTPSVTPSNGNGIGIGILLPPFTRGRSEIPRRGRPRGTHGTALATSVGRPGSASLPVPLYVPRSGAAMIQLLFTVLAAEVAFAVALLFKTPLRRLAVLALDGLKRGRGPVMVRTVAATVLVVLASSVHSMTKIRGRAAGELDGAGVLTPTDQVLLARHLLETSLMGYCLFLALVIDRLHHYIREIRGLKKSMDAVSKQNKTLEEAKLLGRSDESNPYKKEIASLNEEIQKLKLKLKEKADKVKEPEGLQL